MTITVEHTISMGHRLPSYDGICASPHGHNVRVSATILAPSFIDFKAVKDALRTVLDDFDHAMVLAHNDPLLDTLKAMHFRTVALSAEPTTENIAQIVFNELAQRYRLVSVTVYETAQYAATCTSPNALRRMS